MVARSRAVIMSSTMGFCACGLQTTRSRRELSSRGESRVAASLLAHPARASWRQRGFRLLRFRHDRARDDQQDLLEPIGRPVLGEERSSHAGFEPRIFAWHDDEELIL